MDMKITINYESEKPTISARNLYAELRIEKRFSVWFETNSQGFVEGEDYSNPYPKVRVQNEGNREVRREVEDYDLSVDMAKHICLMSHTEKGKQCRQYLIDLEKAWNTPEQIMARALQIANKTITKMQHDHVVLLEDIKRMKPKEVFADAVSASDTSMLIRDVAKILKQNGVAIGEKRFYQWLRENGYICKGSTSPTQRAMELGLFEMVIRTVERGNGLPIETKTTKVTGKGQQYFINKFLSD